MVLARGERLHNPFNIKKNPKIKWQGQLWLNTAEPIFCEFENDLYGLRAGFINIKNQIKEGFNTIDKLVEHYAPPEDNNDVVSYKAALSKRINKPIDYILGLENIKNLGIAIITQEQGRCNYTDELINQALNLAGVIIHEQIPNAGPSVVDRVCQYLLPFVQRG